VGVIFCPHRTIPPKMICLKAFLSARFVAPVPLRPAARVALTDCQATLQAMQINDH
jgi:hypothetical protein